jgi:hypothetical protein
MVKRVNNSLQNVNPTQTPNTEAEILRCIFALNKETFFSDKHFIRRGSTHIVSFLDPPACFCASLFELETFNWVRIGPESPTLNVKLRYTEYHVQGNAC